MANRLVLEEKYSAWWTQITIGLALSAVLLYLMYTNVDDVLWKGILRLGSFGFLAGAVLSGLKVMEGKHTIILVIVDEHLKVSYWKRERKVGEDIFRLENITALHIDRHPSYFFPQNAWFAGEFQVVLDLYDSDRPLALAEVDGRRLILSQQTAAEAVRFIARLAPDAAVPEQYRDKQNNRAVTESGDG